MKVRGHNVGSFMMCINVKHSYPSPQRNTASDIKFAFTFSVNILTVLWKFIQKVFFFHFLYVLEIFSIEA